MLLHLGTNNTISDSPVDIFDKLKSLVDSTNCHLSGSKAAIRDLIRRTDNRKANGTRDKVNKLLKSSDHCVLENYNIHEKHLGKHGFHLNVQGHAMLAINLLHPIRNQ